MVGSAFGKPLEEIGEEVAIKNGVGVRWSKLLLGDRDGAFEQGASLLGLPKILMHQCQVRESSGYVGMLGANRCFVNRKGAFEQGKSLAGLPKMPVSTLTHPPGRREVMS